MEIYLIAQSGVIALIHIHHESTSHTDLHIYMHALHSALKTKLNQKHCLKFMWSIDYGLAIVNEEDRGRVVRKVDNIFIDLLMNLKYLKYSQ